MSAGLFVFPPIEMIVWQPVPGEQNFCQKTGEPGRHLSHPTYVNHSQERLFRCRQYGQELSFRITKKTHGLRTVTVIHRIRRHPGHSRNFPLTFQPIRTSNL